VKNPIILFDGVCNFCNGWVNFILNVDKNGLFKFAALQSEAGLRIQKEAGTTIEGLDTVYLVEGDNVYSKSTATLKILRHLGGIWYFPFVFLLICPRFLRDWVYDLIARNRYKWFGKKDSCPLPGADFKDRFIDK